MKHTNNIQTELYLLEHTYQEASTKIKSKSIRSFLEKLANKKKVFRSQLPSNGKHNAKTEVMTTPKVDIGTSDAKKILVNCLNKEEKLIKVYQKLLNTDRLDQNHHLLLSRQLNNALISFNQLRAIKLSGSYS